MSGAGLETPRAQIIPVTAEDAPLLCAYARRNRAFLAPWEPAREEAYYTQEAWQARAAGQQLNAQEDRGFSYSIRLKNQPDIIGICNFSNVVRGVFQACHLGFSLDQQQQGRGLMAEAIGALIPHVFAQHGLHRIMANYMPRNHRSGRLLERLGFEREGLARDYLKIAGRWEDHVLMARLAPQGTSAK